MEKEEIIKILEDLNEQLNMSPEDYANYVNERYNHDDSYKVEPETAYAFRTGVVRANIEFILDSERRTQA